MSTPHSVMIVEPNHLLRAGLRALLGGESEFAVVADAANSREAIEQITVRPPDVVMTDIALDSSGEFGGVEAIAEIKRRSPYTAVLVLTAQRSHHHVRQSLAAGANGYLLKDTRFDEVLMALRSVARGRTFLSPDVSGHVVRHFLDPKGAEEGAPEFSQLTRRERSILRLVAEGRTNRDAALVLHLSPKTVEKHRASLMRKLGLRSVAELAVLALEAGFIERSSSVRRAVDAFADASGR